MTNAADKHTDPLTIATATNTSPAQKFSGWRVVICLAIAQSFGVGLMQAFGVVISSVAADFSLSLATASLGMSIFLLGFGAFAPVVGVVVDRGPAKLVMLGGVLVMVCGVALLTRASESWQLGLGMFITALGLCCYGPLPVNAIIVNWIVANRGSALAISAAGMALAGFWVPPAVAYMMQQSSWREALQLLSYIALFIAFPIIAFGVQIRPEDVGQTSDGMTASATDVAQDAEDAEQKVAQQKDFWLMGVGFAFLYSVGTIAGIYFVPLAESYGEPLQRASLILSVMAVFGLLGSLGGGYIADRFDPRKLVLGVLLLDITGLLVLWLNPNFVVSLCAAALVGIANGVAIPMQPLFTGRRFGRAVAGKVMGLHGAMGLPVFLAAIPMAGFLFERAGDINVVVALMIGLAVLSAVLFYFMRLTKPR